MSGDNNVNPDLAPLSMVPPIDGAMMDLDTSAGRTPNPMHRIHSALRGRYGIAIFLALVGAATGAILGYTLVQPVYQSTGLIQISSVLPTVIGNGNSDNSAIPNFDGFMDGQLQFIGSAKIIEQAMKDDRWSKIAPKSEVIDESSFTNNLIVTHDKGSEMIEVAFNSTSKEAAQGAVSAVIDDYISRQKTLNIDGISYTDSDLKIKTDTLNSFIKTHQNTLDVDTGNFSAKYPANLDFTYSTAVSGLQTVEKDLPQAIHDYQVASSASSRPSEITEEELSARFPEIRTQVQYLRSLRAELQALGSTVGVENPKYKEFQTRVFSAQSDLDGMKDRYGALVPGGSTTPETLATLKSHVDALEDQQKHLRSDVGTYATQRNNMLNDKAQLEAEQRQIADANSTLTALITNADVSTNKRYYSPTTGGSLPSMPLKDRRIAIAAAAGIGLGGLGFGFVLYIGLVDRRLRHIDDVSSAFASRARVLGVLPYLPEDLSDPLQVANAAQAVHQIRTMLQRRRGTGDKTVICITSANPGVGKTSLAVALGLSFAASGSKTLLIDCDIIGGGLTAKMKKIARRRLGHLLRREGRITTQQLLTAVNEVQRTGRRIGEVLVDLGFVSQADVEWALGLQQNTQVGLREAINGDPIGECIAYSGSPRLWVMPLGSAERRHAAQLTFSTLQRIIGQARNLFNVIIIDTGPICGSLEGPVAAMAADEVVLTVARGDHRPMIEQAIQLVNSNGSNLAGLVLNRADADDIAAAGHSSSVGRLTTGRPATSKATNGHANGEAIRLGPVGTAVASLTDTRIDPSSHVEDSQ